MPVSPPAERPLDRADTVARSVAQRRRLPGAVNVSWGDWSHFVAYTAKINGFLLTALAPGLGVLAIAAELVLGLALLIGTWRRPVAWATCGLVTLFALAMTLSFGVKCQTTP